MLGVVGPSGRVARPVAARKESYARLLQRGAFAPETLSLADCERLTPSDLALVRECAQGIDAFYKRATSCVAKAELDPSSTTVSEHIEVAQLRAFLEAVFP